MNYIGIHITKYVKDLYAEIYKIMMKEIKDLKKWRDRRILFMDWNAQHSKYITLNMIYRFNSVTKKIF